MQPERVKISANDRSRAQQIVAIILNCNVIYSYKIMFEMAIESNGATNLLCS